MKASKLRVLTLCLLISGCSTPHSRIEKNKDAFVSYPPEVQAKVQNGEIDKGFTEEMVAMAKGEPTEKSSIKRAGKLHPIWKYALPYASSSAGSSESWGGSAFGYPNMGTPPPTAGASGTYQRAYFIVEFEDGKVVDWSEHGR